jgi:hypothetical protein
VALLTGLAASCGSPGALSRSAQHGVTAALATDTVIREIPNARAIDVDRFADIFLLANSSLIKLSPHGDSLRSVSGLGTEHYQFNDPVDLDARFPNTVLVADRLNHRVEIYSRDLAYLGTLYTRSDPDTKRRFGYPRSVGSDAAGNIFVLDGEGQRVLKFRSDRTYELTFGGYAESSRPEGVLLDPVSLSVDNAGNVAVLDRGGSSIVTFDNFGTPIARSDIEPASKVVAASDSLFVLRSSGSLDVFASPSLVSLGACTAPAHLSDITLSGARGVAIVDGRIVERVRFAPTLPATH